MSIVLAGASGFTAVLGAWNAVAVIQARDLSRIAAPVRAALGSGAEPTVEQRRRMLVVTAGCLLASGYLLLGLLPALVLAGLAPVVASAAIRIARERWRRDLAAGAPAAARAIADALSGGHSPVAAIGVAAHTGAVPGASGRELRAAAASIAFGGDAESAITSVARRSASASWELIAAAFALQRRVGGDLADLLRRVAGAAEERERSEADARALTTQARFTARVVAGMPIAGALLAEAVMPGSLGRMLSSPLSLLLVLLAGAVLVVSFTAIGRIGRRSP